jgi:hypothetical protein
LQQPDLNLPPNDLAYIAGFIDSDGSIHATRDNRGSYPSYRVTVTVTNVSQEICDWFMARFMVGRVYTLGKPRSEHHTKPTVRNSPLRCSTSVRVGRELGHPLK